MNYNYFDLSNNSLDEWQKVFKFCLGKSDCFNINHILNYENFDENSRRLFSFNNVKTEELWHFDYNNFSSDEIELLKEVYRYTLNKSDFFYLCVPTNNMIDDFIDAICDRPNIKIQNVVKDQKEYYEIFASIDEVCKKGLFDIKLFDTMQKIEFEWRFKLFNSFWGFNYFTALNKYVGILLTNEDLKYFEEKNIILREKLLSNVTAYGELKKELFAILVDMFVISATKPYKLGIPFFTNFTLFKANRQMLYFSFDTLFVCLSDIELQELLNEYRVDISKWNLVQKKSIYQAPLDYISLNTYELW